MAKMFGWNRGRCRLSCYRTEWRKYHHFPSQLSGGEEQRVAIARSFINNPKILFADEPTGNLDSKNGNAVMDMLVSLNKENNSTLIIVTQCRTRLYEFLHKSNSSRTKSLPCG